MKDSDRLKNVVNYLSFLVSLHSLHFNDYFSNHMIERKGQNTRSKFYTFDLHTGTQHPKRE